MKDEDQGKTLLRPIPGRGWPTSSYSRNVSLAVDDRTFVVTDEAGQPHRFPIGNQPGHVFGLGFHDVILEHDTEALRMQECVVAVDIDGEPLAALMPTDRWPAVETWGRSMDSNR